jgi:hypothetical protein
MGVDSSIYPVHAVRGGAGGAGVMAFRAAASTAKIAAEGR